MHLAEADISGGIIGGLLIGIASSTLLFLTGKVTGISGIAHTLATARNSADLFGWRAAYVAGLLVAGALVSAFRPESFGNASTVRPYVAVAAGIIVGFGTRLGSGCTSGHGVCGVPRFSPRSIAAVLTFMATGAVTASFVRQPQYHDLFFQAKSASFPFIPAWVPTAVVLAACYVVFQRNGWLRRVLHMPPVPSSSFAILDSAGEFAAAFACALAFGVALGLSGMTNPERVQGFLDFAGSNGWDYTLMLVMGAAVAFNALAFSWMRKGGRVPLFTRYGSDPQPLAKSLVMGAEGGNMLLDWRLFVGSALFGIGWGLAGVCPGPSIVGLGAGLALSALFVPSMLGGMALYEAVLGGGLLPKPRTQ